MIKYLNKLFSNNLDLAGILDGKEAFIGPELVQIDLTNACNNDCIGCWCRSPLLGDRMMPQNIQKQTLSLDRIQMVLDECAQMGTTNIYLAGGGEPFMHPDIMDIVGYIKKIGLSCHIHTNFTLVSPSRASELVEMGVDHLIVSLWAATPDTYSRTHPNKTISTFETIVNTLKQIVDLKQGGPPHIVLYHVIMNLNYHELQAMVSLAAELEVNAIEFAVVDVIPGFTDKLLLNEKQRYEVLEACGRVQKLMKRNQVYDNLDIRIDDFIQRISTSGATEGNYEAEMLNETPCLIGWNFARIVADGNVNSCLKAHRIPVGNIYEKSFREIWNSPEQMKFRCKTREGNINDPFFSQIGNDGSAKVGCHRGCDDIERNRRLWKRLQQQTWPQKKLLRGVGYLLNAKTLLSGRK